MLRPLALLVLLAATVSPVLAKPATEKVKEAIETTQKTPEQADLDRPRLVIKNGSVFMVLDPAGMMTSDAATPYGLYLNDTRYLSGLTFKINGKTLVAKTTKSKDGYKGSFNYDSSDLSINREVVIDRTDKSAVEFEQLTLKNIGKKSHEIDLAIDFNFDFKDMFEVRGQSRKAHGTVANAVGQNNVKSTYTGLDRKILTSQIRFSTPLQKLTERKANYKISLPPGQSKTINLTVSPESVDLKDLTASDYLHHKKHAESDFNNWRLSNASIKTENDALNQVFDQAIRDLYVLKIETPRGPGFAAGLPWYAVAFGRDQIITAMQTLDFAPASARQIILLMAKYQGVKNDPFTLETPGKIMHELRTGEMARCKEIPFIPYYGTVDATPLWLSLLNRYVERTGDIALAKSLWPKVELSLAFLKRTSPDDFLFYGRADAKDALTNQAWKDSGDSVMHKNGKLASAPVAICEVQGYLYDAWKGAASLARKLDKQAEADELEGRAAKLKAHFKKSFWMTDEDFVALAVDSSSEPCNVVASNPGHLLSSGIVDESEAKAISQRLLKDDMFSGWGIRTLSSKEKAYDAKSYHNGSIWPHDNALIVEGMSKRGLQSSALQVITPLLQVAVGSKDKRLPELFCGYPRGKESAPKPYAVSCVPQLWCVGSVFEMVKALTGLCVTPARTTVNHPDLPPGINVMTIEIPRAGGIDLIELKRQNGKVTSRIVSKIGNKRLHFN